MTDEHLLYPPGLILYCDSHDVVHGAETLATCRRAGASGAFLLGEGVNGHRAPLDTLKKTADLLRSRNVKPILFVFPAVDGDLSRSLDWYMELREKLGVLGQLDAEPNAGHHWSPDLLGYWLRADPEMTITSTSAEAPHLGDHGRLFFLQLEMQNSIGTLAARLKVYPDAALVTGVFDQKDDPRTVAEVEADLRACAPQARRTRYHAEWSAHTMTAAKADATRRFVADVWGARAP